MSINKMEVSKKEEKVKAPKRKKNNAIKESISYRIFTEFNYTFLFLIGVLCLFPLLNVLAQSFSHDIAIQSGKVFLLPINFNSVTKQFTVGFNTAAYEFLIANKQFWLAFWVSIQRVVLGTIINLFLIITVAYPCSQESKNFPARTPYIWFFFVTMLFSGGLIPTYYIVSQTGIKNTLWALILPAAVPVYNVILMLNFFRQLPKELDEAAFMDGAGHWTVLFKIYLPTSLPSIATITLFTIVGHWNDWFSGLLYMDNKNNYPLQTYLQTLIKELNTQELPGQNNQNQNGVTPISKDNLVAAQIFIGAIPILMVYPFLQKYFAKGIVLGSVKG